MPAVPVDRVRLHVALYKMTRALGLPHPDFTRPDHELLEEIAEWVTPILAAAWYDGNRNTDGKGNPYDAP